ncbi:MAG: DUF4139 domain-containing protein [Polyangiaceae bacterium]|nr:DUF4139 domain-containing protein [Polyangiaceae bacterium]
MPRKTTLLFALPLAYALTGCATTTPLVQSDLPLRRVVIYRNGVGYFERAGQVNAPEVRFKLRQGEVGDFLATMAVMETGGSSVRSASFPMKIDDGGDDEPDEPEGPYLRPVQPRKKKDPNGLVDVLLSLDGKRHDLQVGYVGEMPVWRPSYRLVIQPGGAAELQAWGIVQNVTGEDWSNVRLSLVAGAPLSFQPTLGEAIIPPRPTVTDSGEVIGAMPGAETSLAPEPPAPPPPPPPEPKPSAGPGGMGGLSKAAPAKAEKRKARAAAKPSSRAAASGAGPSRGDDDERPKKDAEAYDAPAAAQATAPVPRQAVSRPRDLASLAAVAIEGSTTRYDIPVTVSVPDKSATMVMLVSTRVPGESVFLYAPAPGVPDSQSHPFRVARFTNQTAGLLERGPIAVFEEGAFLGSGLVDPLPPGATTTVPFALERAIAVETTGKVTEEGARVARIEGGGLTIERDLQFRTVYTFKNGGDQKVKVMVKHPRHGGTRLYQPPTGTEDNVGTGAALVPGELGPHAKIELPVDERQTLSRGVDWFSELANEAVLAYVADSRADAAAAAQLKKLWELRPALMKSMEEQSKLDIEEQELLRSTAETRDNIKAIEKNPQAALLRKELTERLQKDSSRLNDINKRKVEVRLGLNEQRIRFTDLAKAIKLTHGLPAPK